MKSRPLRGSSEACSPEIVPPCVLWVVSTSALFATTSRLSVRPPASSVKSTRRTEEASTRTPFAVAVLKPVRLAVTFQSPSGSSEKA